MTTIIQKIACKLKIALRAAALLVIATTISLTGYGTGDDGIVTSSFSVLAGSPLVANSSPLTVGATSILTYSAANEQSKVIQNIITLSLWEETPSYIPNDFTVTIPLLIEYGPSAGSVSSITQSLQITYTKGEGTKYNAKQYFHFQGAQYVKITVQPFTAPMLGSFDTKTVLIVQQEMRVTRYYELANNVQPTTFTSTLPAAGDDEMQIAWSWPATAGHTHTQLEWTWLEDELASMYGSPINYALLFRNNSTRIELPRDVSTYKIPLLYAGQGKLYCRIRAVNIKKSGNRSDGPWSTPQFQPFAGHNNSLNWQTSISFSETGKRQVVVEYFDGSFRRRQVVTKDNVTNTVIASETMYDAQGREAVEVLPAPGTASKIAYTPGLNLFMANTALNLPSNQALAGDPAAYFDLQPIAAPTNVTAALNPANGAANYYSASNTQKTIGANKFIADAEGYPYVVTRYFQDGTGRIAAQSGLGAAQQMGKGHEVKYFYGTVAQEELDGLFGTEAGNYTHYTKTMVRDENGQTSVRYTDIHGRIIATALAGEAPANLVALDLNATDYLNQSGTNITRNLLDNNSNAVKNNSVESINSLLLPSLTSCSFRYELNPQILQLANCSAQPICYDCMYDLTITITEESGDVAPIVRKFNNVSLTPDDNCATAITQFKNVATGAISNIITFSESLPAGSYSIRKTLTISESSLKTYKDLYLTKGLCKTEQQLIDSVYAALLAVSDCDDPPPANTCTDCLNQLGTFANFQTAYLASLGNPNPVPAETTLEIQTAYNTAKRNCDQLCNTISQNLFSKRALMLADMIPFSGQYAKESGSGTMFNKYDIFSTTTPATQPFYRKPWNSSQTPDYYRNTFGVIDPLIHPGGNNALLDVTTKQEFAEKFVNSWAEALLPHHPEYPKLKFAEQELIPSYDWMTTFMATTTFAQATTNGYIFTSSGNLNDPFYTEAPSYKANMVTWVTSNYRNNLSLWQLAYGEVACKTMLDPGQRNNCYVTAPKTSNGYGSLTAAERDRIWVVFRNLYAMERDNQVNAYIAASVSLPDAAALVSANYLLHFPVNNNQLAQQFGPDWSWFPATPGATPDVTNIPGGSTPTAVYTSRCNSYIEQWTQALLQCPALDGHANKAQIISEITTAMASVCLKGSNENNPFGSSEVLPTLPNDGSPRSFEEIIENKFVQYGIAKTNLCNPFVIKFPKSYNKGPLFAKQVITSIDTCHCKRFDALKIAAAAAGKNTAVLSSFNEYLSAAFGEVFTQVLFDGLTVGCPKINTTACFDSVVRVSIGCSDPIPCNCVAAPPSGGICYVDCLQKFCNTINPYPLATPQVLPEFLKCGFTTPANCFSCAQISAYVTEFKTEFNAPYNAGPIFTGTDLTPTNVRDNILFAQFVNYRTGLNYNWVDYARAAATASPVCNLANYASNGSFHQTVICRDNLPLNDPGDIYEEESPCQHVQDMAVMIGKQIYQQRKEQLLADFEKEYRKKCLAAKDIEQFTVAYLSKEYHYTLYYYDMAGNLVKTVPPKAVRPNFSTAHTNSVKAARAANSVLRASHTEALTTNYRYNSIGMVIAQKSPDAGTSKFWYDKLGRIAVSQHAQQAVDGKYSYSRFDALGRVIEVGQKPQTTPMTQTISQDDVQLYNWLNVNGGTREQLTITEYDIPYGQDQSNPNGILYGTELTQRNLRNRISYTATKNLATDLLHYTATFYTYDIHGNIDTLLQDYNGVTEMVAGNKRYRRVVYDFDLVSNQVNMISYHPDRINPQSGLWIISDDKFFHKYEYDANKRLTAVYTSRDKIYWERDAEYSYYKHGSVSRKEFGKLRVQGLDYAYTIQGWLKGVNTTALGDGTKDMGQDGYSAGNPTVARDVIGFGLHYYDATEGSDTWQDYKAINGTSAFARPGGSNSFVSLYNGNIGAISMNNGGLAKGVPANTNALPLFYKYRYDQLNRFTSLQPYKGLNSVTNQWTPLALNDYVEVVTYDPNGNIKTYNRKGAPEIGMQLNMDALVYNYETDKNRVSYIADPTTSGNYPTDIDGQSTGNYTYYQNGNLKSDAAEGITNITWNAYGKITSIVKASGTITFTYDAFARRITKTANNVTTIYVRDANGNVMSTYSKPPSPADLQKKESHIYGSGRIGIVTQQTVANTTVSLTGIYGTATVVTFTRNEKIFELTNHLGNVLATVSDKRIQVSAGGTVVDYYTADIITASDYYPFGMLMPGRVYAPGAKHRYGFNGQERDDDIKGEGNSYEFEYRIYDPRAGRFLSVDPLQKSYPQYTPYQFAANNPILAVDIEGLESSNDKNPTAHVTPDGGIIRLPAGATNLTFADNSGICVGVDGRRFYIMPGSLMGFTFNGKEYQATYWVDEGRFASYDVVRSDGIFEETIDYNTKKIATHTTEIRKPEGVGQTLATGGSVLAATWEAPPAAIATGVTTTLVVIGKVTLGTIVIVTTIHIIQSTAPTIPIGGYAPTVPTTVPANPTHGNDDNNPNPHIVYEIGGYDVTTMEWTTLKYGIADQKYNTYGGVSNRRPDGQLGGKLGDNLRADYPNLFITRIIWYRATGRRMAKAIEEAMVLLYMATHNGQRPPEQDRPQP